MLKYPDIKVKLVGNDGNAWNIMAQVCKALRDNGIPNAKIDEYTKEAMEGDYDHLLRVTMKWVEVY